MRRPDAIFVADLWFFVHAARLCSFSAAAKLLNVTQGAVSQRIHRLEKRLGEPLFVRQGTRLSLTPAGRTLYDSASAAYDLIGDALARLTPSRADSSIVVSCLPSLAIQWLVPRLGEFHALHPAVRLELRAEFSRISAESMQRDGIDVAIRYDREPFDPALELARVPELVFPVCSERYAARMQKQRKWSLLCDSMPWDGATRLAEWDLWQRGLDRSTIHAPTSQRWYNLAQMAYAAALEHQGVALGRGVLVHRFLLDGSLVPLPNAPAREIANYRVLVRRDMPAQHPTLTFARWLAGQLERTKSDVQVLLTALSA